MKIGIIGAGNIGGTRTSASGSLATNGVRAALAQAHLERKPEWSGTAKSPGTFENPA
jgi:hypothetical protein